MKRLIVVLSSILAALCNGIACDPPLSKTKRQASNGYFDFPPYNHHAKLAQMYHTLQGQGLSYFKEPTLQHDATKQSPPLVLQYHPATSQATFPLLSNTHLNQQYQTVPPQGTQHPAVGGHVAIGNNVQAAQYLVSPHQLGFQPVPTFNQQPVYFGRQAHNPYTVKQASLQPTTGHNGLTSSAFNKEYNHEQIIANTDVNKYLQLNPKPVVSQSVHPVPQIQAKQVTTKSLVDSQIYHPLHTAIKTPESMHQQYSETLNMAPPTPPRIYKNFHPIIAKMISTPATEVPIREDMKQQYEKESENSSLKQEQEDEEEVEEEQRQVEDDEDNERYKEEGESDDEEYFRPAKYNYANRFKNEDDDHDFYRRYNDNDEEKHYEHKGHKYSESRPEYSKLSSKNRYPNNQERFNYFKTKEHAKPTDEYKGHQTGSDFKKPNVEYKMYQYSKSTKNPHRKDNLEGKESEIIPKIHARKNLYEEKWMITKTSSTMN